MSYHHEVVSSPERSVFSKEKYRRWHVMKTMVEYQGQRVAGRFVIPLRLVQPPETPGLDMEAASYLVGRSWAGGVLQVPVYVWIKREPTLFVPTQVDPDGYAPSRDYPCLFLLVREWRDVSPKDAPHPVLGPMTVRVNPCLVDTPKGRVFENEAGEMGV